jgi:hypothetical protein
VNGVLLDRLELSFLSGLQDQRVVQNRVRSQTQAGIEAMRNSGMPAAASTAPSSNGTGPTEEADAGGIINRSPTTHYHYYQQATAPPPPTLVVEPQPAPAPARSGLSPWWLLLLVPLLLGAGALAWYLWPKTTPTPVAPPPNWTADPTVKFTEPP